MPRRASSKSSSTSISSGGGSGTPESLREIVQNHILNDVFKASNTLIQQHHTGSSSWMVLVVDPESLRVISSSVGMYNLMEQHVSIVEDLMKVSVEGYPLSIMFCKKLQCE